MADSVVVRARQSLNSVHVIPDRRPGGVFAVRAGSRSTIRTSRSLSGYGSGRSSTALTTLKTAVVAPMPSASVMTAAAAKPGLRTRPRAAYETSRRTSSIQKNMALRICVSYITHMLQN